MNYENDHTNSKGFSYDKILLLFRVKYLVHSASYHHL